MLSSRTPSKLELARQREGISRAKAAAHVDLSERQLYRIERGLTPAKRVYLRALADLYHVPLDELLTDEVA